MFALCLPRNLITLLLCLVYFITQLTDQSTSFDWYCLVLVLLWCSSDKQTQAFSSLKSNVRSKPSRLLSAIKVQRYTYYYPFKKEQLSSYQFCAALFKAGGERRVLSPPCETLLSLVDLRDGDWTPPPTPSPLFTRTCAFNLKDSDGLLGSIFNLCRRPEAMSKRMCRSTHWSTHDIHLWCSLSAATTDAALIECQNSCIPVNLISKSAMDWDSPFNLWRRLYPKEYVDLRMTCILYSSLLAAAATATSVLIQYPNSRVPVNLISCPKDYVDLHTAYIFTLQCWLQLQILL